MRSRAHRKDEFESASSHREEPRTVADAARSHTHAWLAGAVLAAVGVCVAGWATPTTIGTNFHMEPLFILIALDRYADMIGQTNALSVVARKAARATRGESGRMAFLFVGFLLLAGAVNNNVTTCMLVLPSVLMTLRALEANAQTINRTTALVLAAGNVAGAATPTGDFPALLLIASGAISYGDYFRVGTPMFLVTALVLALVYRRVLRIDTDRERARLGFALVALSHKHETVNRGAVLRLSVVFVGMIIAWLASDPQIVSPALVAWAGLATAGVVVNGTGVQLRLDAVEMNVPVKLAAILLASAALASTGVVDAAATFISTTFHSRLTVLIALMIVTAVAAGVADASAAAAGLLPLVLRLTDNGQLLASCRPLTVVAYAAAVCAGSSLWTTSATAGQLLEQRVTDARLTDGGVPVRFSFKSYVPFGALNFTVQLTTAILYVTVAVLVFKAAG